MDHNNEESLPNDFGNDSETFPKASEDVQNVSEEVPKASETNAETFRNVPKKERTADHTLTVRDIARIFEENNLAVTERTITNWCKPNAKGVCRLDAVYDESEYRYYITPHSVERVIKEESGRFRKIKEFFWPPSEKFPNVSERNEPTSESFPNASETNGNLSEEGPKVSERNDALSESFPKQYEPASESKSHASETHRAPDQRDGNSQESRDKFFQLQAEVMELKIENKAKDFFIEQLKNDRETFRKSFEDERRQFIELISNQAAQIGEYKEKLLQLEAPRHEGRVHDATIEEQPHRDEPREGEASGSERYDPNGADGFGRRH